MPTALLLLEDDDLVGTALRLVDEEGAAADRAWRPRGRRARRAVPRPSRSVHAGACRRHSQRRRPGAGRLIAGISEAAGPGVRVAVCGEVGGEPAATPLLVGLGVHELSMSPPAIPAVKEAVRSLSATGARALAALTLDQHSAAGVRTQLDSSGST